MAKESTEKTGQENQDAGSRGHWSEAVDYSAYGDKAESAKKLFSKYDTQEIALKSYVDAQAVLGKPIKLPDSLESLDEVQRAEVDKTFAKLYGIPEKAEDYQLDFAVGLPEGQNVDDNLIGMFKEHAVKNKYSKAQAQAAVGLWNELMTKAITDSTVQFENEAKENLKGLQARWGSQTDNRLTLVNRALMFALGLNPNDEKSLADPKWIDWHDKMILRGVARDPALITILDAGARSMLGEGKILPVAGTEAKTQAESDDHKEVEALKVEYPITWKEMCPLRLRHLI